MATTCVAVTPTLRLVNTVDGVLAQAGLDRSDVGCYVVGRGPGSFTGVRIGISTAKGLARGANVPLLGVSTLDACAWTAWKAGARQAWYLGRCYAR